MRYVTTCAAAVALCATLAAAPPSIKGPGNDITVRPGRAVVITIETDAKDVTWIYYGEDSDDADLIPGTDKKSATFAAPNPGRYTIRVVAAGPDGSQSSVKFYVTVGQPGPPKPDDPLVKSFREAMTREKEGDTVASQVKALSAVYAAGAKLAGDPTVVKWGDLFTKMSKEAADRKLGGQIPAVQAAVSSELKKKLLGADGKPVVMEATLSAADRVKAAAELSRIAAGLAAASNQPGG